MSESERDARDIKKKSPISCSQGDGCVTVGEED